MTDPNEPVPDLMARLRESLEAARRRRIQEQTKTFDDLVHYHLPGADLTLCGEDPYGDDFDYGESSTDEAGTGTCPVCRKAADEEEVQ